MKNEIYINIFYIGSINSIVWCIYFYSTIEFIEPRTLDFEEFLWVEGFNDEQVSYIKDVFKERKPLSNSMHETFSAFFREYFCICGFPGTVKTMY